MALKVLVRRLIRQRNRVFFFSLTVLALIVFCNYQTVTQLVSQTESYTNGSNEFHRYELRVDRSAHSRDEIARDTQKVLPQLPVLFWEEKQYQEMYYKNASCARFPDLNDLHIYDVYWQSLQVRNFTFHLYAAHYDVRKRCSYCPAIRIIGMIDSNWPPGGNIYCQIWFANMTETVIAKTTEYFNIMRGYWNNYDKGYLYAYLITCPVPEEVHSKQPIFVSLVEKMCNRATNILSVTYNKLEETKKKNNFAVCVKMLDYPYSDESVHAVEWIELVRLLGASKIFLYTLHVHENMTKVFQYYEKQGIVQVVPVTLAGYEPNFVGLQHLTMRGNRRNWYQRTIHELISLNDCFYRNMYKYNYITSLDIDEVIVPVKEYDWIDLLDRLSDETSSDKDTFMAKNTIFTPICDNETEWQKHIPTYMHMLQHVLINPINRQSRNTKAFFRSESVKVIHNHYAMRCLTTKHCKWHLINPKQAKVHHYRAVDRLVDKSCEDVRPNLTTDTTLWKYKEPLIDCTVAVLYDLGFFS